MNILILCHANRWRSPLVHGYLNLLAWGLKLPHQPPEIRSLDINFCSAGFKQAGLPAGKPIRDVAVELGFSLEDHKSEVISPEHVTNADLIIHMGPGNERRLRHFLNLHGMDVSFYMGKAYCLGSWCKPTRANIQDFAFLKRDTEEFDTVVRYTVAACERLMREVIVPQATEEQAKGAFVTETEKDL